MMVGQSGMHSWWLADLECMRDGWTHTGPTGSLGDVVGVFGTKTAVRFGYLV
jgi:hypothetical protein